MSSLNHRVMPVARIWRIFVYLVLLLLVVFALGFSGGYLLFRYDAHTSERRMERLDSDLNSAQNRLQELSRTRIAKENKAQIDTLANRELDSHIQALYDENLRLQQEVRFFRDILKPSSGGRELMVRNFEVVPSTEPDLYQVSFTLAVRGELRKSVTGHVRFSVYGDLKGTAEVLPMEVLLLEPKKRDAYKFRYLHKMDYQVHFPNEFSPQMFIVDVLPSGGEKDSVKQMFNWPVNSL